MTGPDNDPYTEEDFKHFSKEEFRAYLDGHRSRFTVAELEHLDEAYENRFNDNKYEVRIRFKCTFLNNLDSLPPATKYTIPQVALRSRPTIFRKTCFTPAGWSRR